MRTHYKRFFRARKIFSSPPRASGIDCGNESDRARKRERAGAEKIAPPLRGFFFFSAVRFSPCSRMGSSRLRRASGARSRDARNAETNPSPAGTRSSRPPRAAEQKDPTGTPHRIEPPQARSLGEAAKSAGGKRTPERAEFVRRRTPKESVPAGYSRGNAVYNLITDSGLDHYESEVFAWPQLICGGDAKRRARECPGPREVRTQTGPESRRRARALPRISRR